MNSKYMKACLSAYFRWKKGIKFIATECGYYNSDFLAITKTNLVEIEIKTSKADLNNDFKKPKHKIYADGRSDWVPNQFYFAVPAKLADYAIAKCIDNKYGVCVIDEAEGRSKNSSYTWGNQSVEALKTQIVKQYDNVHFLGVEDGGKTWKGGPKYQVFFEHDAVRSWEERVRVVKKAQKLVTRPPKNKVRFAMIARLSSEMANLRITEQRYLAKEKNRK